MIRTKLMPPVHVFQAPVACHCFSSGTNPSLLVQFSLPLGPVESPGPSSPQNLVAGPFNKHWRELRKTFGDFLRCSLLANSRWNREIWILLLSHFGGTGQALVPGYRSESILYQSIDCRSFRHDDVHLSHILSWDTAPKKLVGV